MIPEVSRIRDVLHNLESFGPTACDGSCDPNYEMAIADAKLELLDFEQEAETGIDPNVIADPALIAQFEPAIAALEAKMADLTSIVQPLPKATDVRGLALSYWSYASELDATDLRELILAIGRITNGVIQPGDEATIQGMPDPTWLTHAVYGPWVIVTTLTPLVAMDYMLLLSTFTGGPAMEDQLLTHPTLGPLFSTLRDSVFAVAFHELDWLIALMVAAPVPDSSDGSGGSSDGSGGSSGGSGGSSGGSGGSSGGDGSQGSAGSGDSSSSPEPAAVEIECPTRPNAPPGIPPGVTRTLTVTINEIPDGDAVLLDITGSGGGNGTVTIVGNARLTATGTIQVKGGTQTGSGNGGKLRIRARLESNNDELAVSCGFSVCAHPQNFTTARAERAIDRPTLFALIVRMDFVSDGNPSAKSQLGEVGIIENAVISRRDDPPFKRSGHVTQLKYFDATASFKDAHGTLKRRIVGGVGRIETDQLWEFTCARCDAEERPSLKSGFEIVRELFTQGGARKFKTEKKGAAVNNGGKSSDAGGGSATTGALPYP